MQWSGICIKVQSSEALSESNPKSYVGDRFLRGFNLGSSLWVQVRKNAKLPTVTCHIHIALS